ncbi:MAG: hypothetical protein MUD04_07535 [Cyanobium sp. Prado107]|jgi:hypothetical protein|nr:hypothetical protein [Cyanobium sp. Prado107]
MARFLLVLKPTGTQPAAPPEETRSGLLDSLAPVLDALHADVDHRTPAHIGALLRNGAEHQRMQLFADVQSHADGRLLELVLLSREPMVARAPVTSGTFQRLVDLVCTHLPGMDVVFRSDRDGPCHLGAQP